MTTGAGNGERRGNHALDANVVKALTHPVRVQILGALSSRVASPSELAQDLDVAVSTVSYHVQRLLSLGLIRVVRRERTRGMCQHFYTVVTKPRIPDGIWDVIAPLAERTTIEAQLAAVARYVTGAVDAGATELREADLTRRVAVVDEQGWRDLEAILTRALEDIATVEAESARRLVAADREAVPHVDACIVVMRSKGVARSTTDVVEPELQTKAGSAELVPVLNANA